MIQYKFGGHKSPSNHLKSLNHLPRHQQHRFGSRELSATNSRNSASKDSARGKTPLRQRREEVDVIQHYYTTKNVGMNPTEKQNLRPLGTVSSRRLRPFKQKNLMHQNKEKLGTRSLPKFYKARTEQNTMVKHSSTIRLSLHFSGKTVKDTTDQNMSQIQRMAQEIGKLKERNTKLEKMYKQVKQQKEQESQKIRNYEVELEHKSLFLRKRIVNLNAELREYKPNQMTIYHIETYPKVDLESFSPAFVRNRIEELTVSMEESVDKILALSEITVTEHNTQTCESAPSKKDEFENLCDLSLESQKCRLVQNDF